MKIQNLDKQWIGFVLGLIFPFLGVYVFYAINDFSMPFGVFITEVLAMHLTAKVLSLGVLANLAIFFIGISFKLDKAARGVIAATFVYAAVILILKFFV